jgi:hypothetical protein
VDDPRPAELDLSQFITGCEKKGAGEGGCSLDQFADRSEYCRPALPIGHEVDSKNAIQNFVLQILLKIIRKIKLCDNPKDLKALVEKNTAAV